jgi:hypothetical protein
MMTQIDLGLTSVGRFDSAESVISVNDANQKPGASQPRTASPWTSPLLQGHTSSICSGAVDLPPPPLSLPRGGPPQQSQCGLSR